MQRGVRRLADTHGRVGVNDYNYPFFEGESINEIKELVPLVIKAISSALVVRDLLTVPHTRWNVCFIILSKNLQDLIDLGGKTFVVPGSFPYGCFPAYLTLFQTSKEKEYDTFTGCLSWLSELGKNHDEQLKTELKRLRKLYPHVNIIYADYYNSMYRFFQEPAKYGTWDFRAPPMGILPIEGALITLCPWPSRFDTLIDVLMHGCFF